MLNVHSTRLFPKDLGANQYKLTGIAARCDWIVFSDKVEPTTHLVKRRAGNQPKTVYLSFRWQRAALRFFVETVLPQIGHPFILVSGSEDVTIPNQIDHRMPQFSPQDRDDVKTILDSPYLSAWVAENLDDDSHPKLHPLPLGLVHNEKPFIRELVSVPESPALSARPLAALCGHRVRSGPQWDARRQVTELVQSDWSEWCTLLESDVSEHAFSELIEGHSFVICVEGGGIDPSPKAWLTLLHGAIPIIRKSALSKAYAHLPVVFVDDWSSDAVSFEKLGRWKQQYAPFFDQAGLRRSVLKRLSSDYWWSYVLTCGNS